VGFSENGVNAVENNNYYILENDESFSADWRVSAVYLRVDDAAGNNATASVIAGETGIDSNELSHNWTGSIGVG
jgi:flagellar hook-associated protein FlgK